MVNLTSGRSVARVPGKAGLPLRSEGPVWQPITRDWRQLYGGFYESGISVGSRALKFQPRQPRFLPNYGLLSGAVPAQARGDGLTARAQGAAKKLQRSESGPVQPGLS